MPDGPVYPELVAAINDNCSTSPNPRRRDVNASRTSVKRPWIIPVIEALPPIPGPAPDMLHEWSGKVLDSCPDLRSFGRTRVTAALAGVLKRMPSPYQGEQAMSMSKASEFPGTPPLPLRRDDLHVEELDDEAVLYDARNGAVHRLNATTFLVWRTCDGTQSLEDIAHRLMSHYSVSADEAQSAARHALALLVEKELLDERPCVASHQGDGKTRPLKTWVRQARDGPVAPIPPASATPLATTSTSATTGHGVSRRELLGSGVTKTVLAAPVISTFFAAGADASDWRGSATGPGGCKTIGFSCVINADCCEGGTDTACQDQGGPTKTCCVQHNRAGCLTDSDCCNQGDTCIAGMCN
jgi:PqqD family protein of HPr-rel-A system